ncbi:hypothetical protein YIM1640_08440 [Thermus oshimai]|jgi:hypothetical protein|uniref:DUF3311 domain-containing protein n=1 Tax=Thermus oshimai JL-2 TaxID=751945 RepID=K7QYF4_THEOS|nr:hypothetical protein Theos_0592 [Thermus oshimai JL-2]
MRVRSVLLFLLGVFLFSLPFSLFFGPQGPLGLPPFYLYLFLAWGGLILLLYLGVRR